MHLSYNYVIRVQQKSLLTVEAVLVSKGISVLMSPAFLFLYSLTLLWIQIESQCLGGMIRNYSTHSLLKARNRIFSTFPKVEALMPLFFLASFLAILQPYVNIFRMQLMVMPVLPKDLPYCLRLQ